jgi:large subunit ribosomal protein L22
MATETQTKLAKAKIGFMRQTPRKVRRTVNLIRNMSAGEAVQQLKFTPYEASDLICKMIESAMANASNNLGIEKPEDLRLSQILVDDGVTYKRWRAVSKGRAYTILKRTAKASVVLSEMKPAEYAKYVWDTSPRNKKNRKAKETGNQGDNN